MKCQPFFGIQPFWNFSYRHQLHLRDSLLQAGFLEYTWVCIVFMYPGIYRGVYSVYVSWNIQGSGIYRGLYSVYVSWNILGCIWCLCILEYTGVYIVFMYPGIYRGLYSVYVSWNMLRCI